MGPAPLYNENLLLPAPGEIHVWLHPLVLSGGELALLDPGERERAARFYFEKDRNAFIARHAWLRTLLGGYLLTDPGSIIFGKQGKPAIDGAPLHFNLSHSGALAACAVTRDDAVGIDIELIRPGETSAFFRSWTRREAYGKATGEGLSAPAEPAPGEDWSIIDLDAGPDYACAVAIRGSNWTVLTRRG